MLNIEGQWWFEGEAEHCSGTLTIDKDSLILSLNHGVVSEHIWKDHERKRGTIFGEASDSALISLLDCIEIEVSQSGRGLKLARYRCSEMFRGLHYAALDPPVFTGIYATSTAFDRWPAMAPTDFKGRKEVGPDHDAAIFWQHRKMIFDKTMSDHRIRIFFNNHYRVGPHFDMKSQVVVSLSSERAASYANWRASLEPYRWLLSLLFARTIPIESINLDAVVDGEPSSAKVTPPFAPAGPISGRTIRPAFSFKDLSAEFGALLDGWAPVAQLYQEACELLFDADAYVELPLRYNFLLHAQALESIYRQGIYKKQRGKLLENFRPVRDRLIEVVSAVDNAEFAAIATAKIHQMNELPIRLQLERFFGTFHAATRDAVGIDDGSTKAIGEIRNNLTHAGKSAAGNAQSAHAATLFEVTQQLRFLMFIYLLREAGMHERDCVYRLGSTDEFRWLVNFERFNDNKHTWEPRDYGHSSTRTYMRPTE